MSAEIQVIERQEKRSQVVAAPAAANPMQMIAIAVQQGADINKLQQLMGLQERWEANEARKAYVSAMAAFKAEPLSILKSKRVDIQGGAKFSHATLADVVDGVCSAMSKHGLSHRWETSQANGLITVTCVLTHQMGHSERTSLSGAPDDSGRKNGIQQVASTVTYLERYTLMAACGLAAKDMDDDGHRAGAQRTANKPEGYDNWAANMQAKADEGMIAVRDAWEKSPTDFRVFATADGDWFPRLKAKAKGAA